MKHKNKEKRLIARQKSFDDDKGHKKGVKRPGSLKK